MNILQIIPELHVGGVETGVVDFSKYLVEHGHRSVVISHGGRLVERLQAHGATHYTLPVHKKSVWTLMRMVPAVREIIRAEKIDIVHARSRVPAWIGYFACRATHASFITTCHGYYTNRFFSQVMGWGRLVIVPSLIIGRHMVDSFRVPAEHIRCIPRSVDFSRFTIPWQAPTGTPRCTVAIVGRITPLKGHTFFLQAMAKVIRSVPYAKVLIIGDAPPSKASYLQELHGLVRRLGITAQVEFMGSRHDIPQLLPQVDVLVLSTVTQESFGRVIIEAQAVGVPVVATRVGGVVDIIDEDRTGLLVMPRDADAIARAVLRLVNDKKYAQAIAVAAKEKAVREFTLEKMATRTLAVYDEVLRSRHILVIKISSIGDVILVIPSLKALREKFPAAKIFCLVGAQASKIIRKCPYLDGVIICDLAHADRGLLRLWRLGTKLRMYHFDTVIDLQNNRKSHFLAWLAWAKETYGYTNGKWGWLLSNGIPNIQKAIGPVEHQFQLLAPLGISYAAGTHRLALWLSDEARAHAQTLLEGEWLGTSKRIVGINLAASAKWSTKNWPLIHVAKVCDALAAKNIRVMITGTDKDADAVAELQALTKAKPAVFVGKTDVLQLAALIERCMVFLTPDSAPLHIAAAVGTPCIAFFGPTDPVRHIPPAEKLVVLRKQLNCMPCYSGHCRILTHACMREISPDEVLGAIMRVVKGDA